MKILIVYFSRSGRTETVAQSIAQSCEATLESLEDATTHRGFLGYLRSMLEALLHCEAPILDCEHAPREYDLVVIGTPVWVGNMASPVRTYVLKYRSQFRRIALFCTSSNWGAAKTLSDLEHLCNKPAQASVNLYPGDLDMQPNRTHLSKFVSALRNAGMQRRGTNGHSAMHAPTPRAQRP